MGNISPNYLFYGIIAILAILIITAIIKGAFKLLLLLIIVVLGISFYNIFVKGVSPSEEVKSYSTDFKYASAIKDYSSKVKASVNNIKAATEGTIEKEDMDTILKESENLRKYREEVQGLQHSSKLNFFHNKYLDYLNTIVLTTDGVTKISKLGENKNLVELNNMLKKLSTSLNGLSELKIE